MRLSSSPDAPIPWAVQAAVQLAAGIISYVYFNRQARRFQARVDELTRLEEA